MRALRPLLCVVIGLALCGAGCMKQTSVQEMMPVSALMETGSLIYVALSKDAPGRPGSGESATALLNAALLPYASRVVTGNAVETRQPALASARAAGARYLLVLSLVRWQTAQATGATSSAGMYLSAFDAASGRMLSMRELWARDAALFSASSPAEQTAQVLRENMTSFFSPLAPGPLPSPQPTQPTQPAQSAQPAQPGGAAAQNPTSPPPLSPPPASQPAAPIIPRSAGAVEI